MNRHHFEMVDEIAFMKEAYEFAMEHSTDPSTQNGAVLVDFSEHKSGVIVSYGANHFPVGVEESEERWQRPLKYSYVEHAERNVIFAAAEAGVRTHGLTMYAAWIACADCARAIIQSGVKEVVGHNPDPESIAHIESPNGSWNDSIRIGMIMLAEARVKVRYIDGKIDPTNGLAVRRNGVIFHP